jgi:carbohydrate-selective porin OprB
MGIYRDALAMAAANGTPPDIVADDREGRHKTGFGINIEQPLADDGATGAFARLGWNDGRAESFAFTEVDRLVSVGGLLSGRHWRRAEDRFGAAVAVEGLSGPHRDYLAAGGAGFLLGDGTLRYGHEQILEVFYSAQLASIDLTPKFPLKIQLSPDFQYIRNPAYNRERGPVKFWAVRFHLEL